MLTARRSYFSIVIFYRHRLVNDDVQHRVFDVIPRFPYLPLSILTSPRIIRCVVGPNGSSVVRYVQVAPR